MSKNKKEVSFSDSDIEKYADTSEKAIIAADLIDLKAQCHIDGLSQLSTLMNTEPHKAVNNTDLKIELLQDIAKLSLRSKDSQKYPEYKEVFKEEVLKAEGMQSQEFKDFISSYAAINNTEFHAEKISAIALLELSKQDVTAEQLENKVKTTQIDYKQALSNQFLADVTRSSVVYIDENNESKFINFDIENGMSSENKAALVKNELEKMNLTGEQMDFIMTTWSQSLFRDGAPYFYLNKHLKNEDLPFNPYNPKNSTSLIIDQSNSGATILYNRCNFPLTAMEKDEYGYMMPTGEIVDGAETLIGIDVTNLQGHEYTPGIASADVDMHFNFSSLNDQIKFTDINTEYAQNKYKTANILKKQVLQAAIKSTDPVLNKFDNISLEGLKGEKAIITEIANESAGSQINDYIKNYLAENSDLQKLTNQELKNITLDKEIELFESQEIKKENDELKNKITEFLNSRKNKKLRTNQIIEGVQNIMGADGSIPQEDIQKIKNGIYGLVWECRRKEQAMKPDYKSQIISLRSYFTDPAINYTSSVIETIENKPDTYIGKFFNKIKSITSYIVPKAAVKKDTNAFKDQYPEITNIIKQQYGLSIGSEMKKSHSADNITLQTQTKKASKKIRRTKSTGNIPRAKKSFVEQEENRRKANSKNSGKGRY